MIQPSSTVLAHHMPPSFSLGFDILGRTLRMGLVLRSDGLLASTRLRDEDEWVSSDLTDAALNERGLSLGISRRTALFRSRR